MVEIRSTTAALDASWEDGGLWLFFPDYRGSSPYQSLLAEALAGHAEAAPGTIGMALEASGRRRIVFHLHWEDALYTDAGGEKEVSAVISESLQQLAAFRARGGRLVWTVHNAAPHEDRFPSLSLGLRQGLARLADVVHVHCRTGMDLALGLGAPAERIVIVRHPDIAPAYPDDITDAAARRYFGLAASDIVFANIGANRGYKDIGGLHDGFTALNALIPATRLVLAGRQAGYFEQRYIEPRQGIRLVPRFVDDAVVQYVVRAADFMVLPYRRILTSGALALSFGFGRPAIVPDLPALLDVVRPGENALVYRADDTADLLRVMIEAAELPAVERLRMRAQALQTGREVGFDRLANALLEAIALTRDSAKGDDRTSTIAATAKISTSLLMLNPRPAQAG
ncbi:MAG TPA: glycosyl transferase family 1 [Acidiphilium sp.]|nr:glycosyl transferase family 1 [Acidiphilium sp.]